jgi:hypothetical protein
MTGIPRSLPTADAPIDATSGKFSRVKEAASFVALLNAIGHWRIL